MTITGDGKAGGAIRKKSSGSKKSKSKSESKKGGDAWNVLRKEGPRQKRIAAISRDIETESGVLRGLVREIDTEKARIEAAKSGGASAAAVLAGLELADKIYKHPIVKGAIALGQKVFTGAFKSMKGKHDKISALDNQIKQLSGLFWGLKNKVKDARSTLSKLRAVV